MLAGPVLIDISSLLIRALTPLVDVPVVTLPQANNSNQSPVVIVLPARYELLDARANGFGWKHYVNFRIVHESFSEALALADLLYRAMHALEDDEIRVPGGDFGVVSDTLPPQLIASTALGTKNLTEFAAGFSVVVTT